MGQAAPLTVTRHKNIKRSLSLMISQSILNFFASVRLTVVLLSFAAATVLAGAWCPQEAQVGQQKVIEAFGPDMALVLIKTGVADIFHSYWFLLLVGLLTVNMIVGSFKYVFPKLRLLRQPMPLLDGEAIAHLPFSHELKLACDKTILKSQLTAELKKYHYSLTWHGDRLAADFGKFGRLAPSITHVGLLTLLAGVTITAWTGFSGFKPILVGSKLSFADSQHATYWLGKLPDWQVHVNSSRREDYDNGEAKQWYSSLTVVDNQGHKIKTEEISVNTPLSFDGVDIYQSSWGLGQLQLSFNGHKRILELQPMGKLYAAFLPLAEDSVLIFSVRNQKSPLKIFAKRPDWTAPKLIGEVAIGKQIALGSVMISYLGSVPITGLQYKSDPGLAITFTAFAFIILGVTLAAVPHRHLWAELVPVTDLSGPGYAGVQLNIGGRTVKDKLGFQKQLKALTSKIDSTFNRLPEPSSAARSAPEKFEISGENKMTKQTETANV